MVFKPMTILSMQFKSHNQSLWFKPMTNYISKAQFSLAIFDGELQTRPKELSRPGRQK